MTAAETTMTEDLGVQFPDGTIAWANSEGQIVGRGVSYSVKTEEQWSRFLAGWTERIENQGVTVTAKPTRVVRSRIVILLEPEVHKYDRDQRVELDKLLDDGGF